MVKFMVNVVSTVFCAVPRQVHRVDRCGLAPIEPEARYITAGGEVSGSEQTTGVSRALLQEPEAR